MMTVGETDHERRDRELEDETVAILVDAVRHGAIQPETIRQGLELDECDDSSKSESELHDWRYRITVRRRVLEEVAR